MELGQLIAELREDKGLSQRELGEKIHKSDSAICNYEKGVHTPDIDTVSKMADCFDVSVDYMLQKTKYKYSIKFLNSQLSNDITLGELLNTIIQLDTNNRKRLIDYIGLLNIKNNITKGTKQKDRK